MAANVMTQVEIKVRAANPTDIPAIAALIEPFVDEGKLLERTFDEMNELLPNFFIAATVTEPDGTELIVGCAALEIYSRKLAE
ncbi:MAG: N-acetylglutamate synthase, partial [Phototrophicales bacterium]